MDSVMLRQVIHDLRNPLTAVLGYSELLAERVDDEQAQRYVELIREAAEDMRNILVDCS